MDVSSIVKGTTRLHQQYTNNLFDTVAILQDQAERTWGYWNYKLHATHDANTAIDQFWTFMKGERHDLRNFMNDCFNKIDGFFSESDQS